MQYGVVFDVDGVLVDSYEAHYQGWLKLFDEHQKAYTREMFIHGFGMTTREVLTLQWDSPLDAETQKMLDEKKEQYYRDDMEQNFLPMPGAKELILALKEADFQLGVGSSGPRPNVALAMNRLNLNDIIPANCQISGSDIVKGKPDPEVFTKAINHMGLSPQRCIIVEDAPVGIQAAHASGAKAIGFASKGRTRADLKAANLVIDSLSELNPGLIKEIIDGRN